MLTRQELLQAIAECEEPPIYYEKCDKLATFYILYDHLYGENKAVQKVEQETVGSYGETDFLKQIEGAKSQDAWLIMDELMTAVSVLQPKLYRQVMERFLS